MKKLVAATAVLAFTLSACGGGGGGRPSTDEIADALKSNDDFSQVTDGASDEVVDCIAKKFHDSDVSDEALQALVDGDEDYDGSDEDQKAVEDIATDLQECLTAA